MITAASWIVLMAIPVLAALMIADEALRIVRYCRRPERKAHTVTRAVGRGWSPHGAHVRLKHGRSVLPGRPGTGHRSASPQRGRPVPGTTTEREAC